MFAFLELELVFSRKKGLKYRFSINNTHFMLQNKNESKVQYFIHYAWDFLNTTHIPHVKLV